MEPSNNVNSSNIGNSISPENNTSPPASPRTRKLQPSASTGSLRGRNVEKSKRSILPSFTLQKSTSSQSVWDGLNINKDSSKEGSNKESSKLVFNPLRDQILVARRASIKEYSSIMQIVNCANDPFVNLLSRFNLAGNTSTYHRRASIGSEKTYSQFRLNWEGYFKKVASVENLNRTFLTGSQNGILNSNDSVNLPREELEKKQLSQLLANFFEKVLEVKKDNEYIRRNPNFRLLLNSERGFEWFNVKDKTVLIWNTESLEFKEVNKKEIEGHLKYEELDSKYAFECILLLILMAFDKGIEELKEIKTKILFHTEKGDIWGEEKVDIELKELMASLIEQPYHKQILKEDSLLRKCVFFFFLKNLQNEVTDEVAAIQEFCMNSTNGFNIIVNGISKFQKIVIELKKKEKKIKESQEKELKRHVARLSNEQLKMGSKEKTAQDLKNKLGILQEAIKKKLKGTKENSDLLTKQLSAALLMPTIMKRAQSLVKTETIRKDIINKLGKELFPEISLTDLSSLDVKKLELSKSINKLTDEIKGILLSKVKEKFEERELTNKSHQLVADLEVNKLIQDLHMESSFSISQDGEKLAILEKIITQPLSYVFADNARALVSCREYFQSIEFNLKQYSDILAKLIEIYPNFTEKTIEPFIRGSNEMERDNKIKEAKEAFDNFDDGHFILLLMRHANSHANNIKEGLSAILKDLLMRAIDTLPKQSAFKSGNQEKNLKDWQTERATLSESFKGSIKWNDIVKAINRISFFLKASRSHFDNKTGSF